MVPVLTGARAAVGSNDNTNIASYHQLCLSLSISFHLMLSSGSFDQTRIIRDQS